MELEKQVVSLELAKKIDKLGIKQDSHFVWARFDKVFQIIPRYELTKYYKEVYPTYTVAELGNFINVSEDALLDAFHNVFNQKQIRPIDLVKCLTNPDLVAKMLIYLKENNLI